MITAALRGLYRCCLRRSLGEDDGSWVRPRYGAQRAGESSGSLRSDPVVLLAEADLVIEHGERRFLADVAADELQARTVKRYLDLQAMPLGLTADELAQVILVSGLAAEPTASHEFRRGLIAGALIARDRSGT